MLINKHVHSFDNSNLILFLLQYVKDRSFVENIGLEPMTPCVQGRCSKPTELIPRFFCSPRQS